MKSVNVFCFPFSCNFQLNLFSSSNWWFIFPIPTSSNDTGERRGTWRPVGYTYEHYIFVPEEPKKRREILEKLIKESPGTNIVNCIFSFRQPNYDNNHASSHDNISWNNFCDLTLDQLSELQSKRYYKDGNSIKDKDGIQVNYRDGKIQAIA